MNDKTATVISLGAGVQSSALLFMADRGELGYPVDFAVFADTGAEPKQVYEWLQFLQGAVKIPIVVASRGNIADDIINRISGTGRRFASVPFFTVDKDGKKGMGRRQCTREYKIDVVQKAVREKLGYKPRARMKHQIKMLIGISIDEVDRMKPSRTKWVTHHWPLIEKRMSRQDCIEYVKSFTGKEPPRSACWLCPFRSNEEWRHLKATDPEAFDKAVKLDLLVRQTPGFKSDQYIHASRTPLGVVDFSEDGQEDLFTNECEGICGI